MGQNNDDDGNNHKRPEAAKITSEKRCNGTCDKGRQGTVL